MSLAAHLEELGRPLVEEQLKHPTVAGIARGDLDEAVFRSWLEQDYLYLLDYVRVFSRLAWQAPAAHLGDLVDLAHETYHEEMELHRSLSAE
jgi:thiaminase/transcriptional activator TenA